MTMPRVKSFTYVSGKKYDGMMGRCYRVSDPAYPEYGARGIKVCSSWIKDINSFRVWLRSELARRGLSEEDLVKNSSYYSLDRINVDGPYAPENCRLETPQVQARNKRRTKLVVVSAEGEEICV